MKNTLITTILLSAMLLGCVMDPSDVAEEEPAKPQATKAGAKDPKEFVQGVVVAMAKLDYEEFKKFTCLGMTKEQFKAFMAQNDSRKIARVWDAGADDFVPAFKVGMRAAFDEAIKDSMKGGVNMTKAKIDKVEFTDDIKAHLTAGSAKLEMHLDDCFLTPQGLLMFDAIKVR